MGLLDFLSSPRKSDNVFGNLVYRRRKWHGSLAIAELHADNIPLESQTSKDSHLSATFSDTISAVRRRLWLEWAFEDNGNHRPFTKLSAKTPTLVLHALAQAA